MSNNIENRVVQLEMRNSSLEKGANQSIKTLDKLDKALDLKNGKRSFEDVEKAAAKCNFQPLLKAADTINQRFSTMGIVGVRALERITDKAVDAGLALTKSLTVDQIASGYSKYEQKTASVQTIMNATGKSLEEINGYLDKLMWFSDETSYNFSDMSSALATFTAGGHDIDDMIPMIEGFAASVAFAGKGASEFSHALQYGLVDAFGKKVMMTSDWKTLENLNLNSKQLMETFIATGEALGTIEEGTVTVANFRDSLSKGWLNDKVMSQGLSAFAMVIEEIYDGVQSGIYENYADGLEKIGDKFGEVARAAAESAQQTKTYTEAVDAAKDAASSQWLKIFESIFGDFNQQKELWGEFGEGLIEIFVTPLSAVADIINTAFQETPITKLADKLEKAEVDFDTFKQKVIEVGKTLGTEFGDATDKAESFVDLLSIDGISTEIVQKALQSFARGGEEVTSFVESEVNALDLAKRLNKGEFGYGIEAMTKNLKAAGYEIESARDVYRISAHDADATIKMVGATASEVVENTSEAFKEAYELAAGLSDEYYTKNSGWQIGWDGVRNVLGAIIDRVSAVKKAWKDVFPAPTATAIKDAIVSFHKWSESLKMGETEGEKLTGVARKIFKVFRWGLDVLDDIKDFGLTAIRLGKDLFKTILNTPVVQSFLSKTSKMFDDAGSSISYWLISAKDWLDETGDHLMSLDWGKLISGLEPIVNLAGSLWKLFKRVGKAAFDFATRFAQYLLPVGSYIYDNMIVPFANFLSELIESDDPIKTLKDGLISLGNKVKKSFKKIFTSLKDSKIGTIFGELLEKIAPIIEKLDALKEKLKEVISNAGETNDSIDFGKIISIVTLGVVLIMLSNLSEALKKIGGAASSVQGTFKSLKGIIESKLGTNLATNAKAISGAVVMIAAALYILSSIPEEDLVRASVALGAMIVVLALAAGGMAYAAKKMGAVQVKKVETLIKPILALSGAMLILSFAAKNASTAIGTEHIWERAGAILLLVGGIMLELVGLAWLMTKISGEITVGTVLMMITAVAILKLVQALEILENINLSDDAKSVLGIIGIVALIGMLSSALKKSSNGAGSFLKVGTGILAIATAIYIVIKALETLNQISSSGNGILRGGLLLVVLGTIGLILLVFDVLGDRFKESGKSLALVSAGVLAMVGAIYLMTLVIDKLAAMPDEGNTANAIIGVAVIGLVIAAMTAALGYASKLSNGGKGVIKIVAAVLAMTLVVGAMSVLFALLYSMTSSMSAGLLWRTIGIMAVLVLFVSGLTLATGLAGKLGEGKGLGILIGVIFAMVVMVAALILLTNFSLAEIGPGLLAICACIAALGLAVFLVGQGVKAAASTTAGAVGLIGAVFMLGILGASLAVLATYDWKKLAAAASAICVVLLVLALSMVIIGAAKADFVGVLLAIAMLAAVVVALYILIPRLEALTALDSSAFLKNMAILVGGIVVLLAVLGLASVLLTPILPVMLALAAVVALLGIGCYTAGAGITLLATGLVVFASTVGSNIDKIVSGLTAFVTGMGVVLMALGMVIVTVLVQLIPSLAEAGLKMIVAVLTSFEAHIGEMGNLALQIILDIVEVITNNVERLIQASISLGLAFINGLANGIRNNTDEIMSAVRNILSAIIEMVLSVLGEILGLIPGVGPQLEEALSNAKEVVRDFLAPETDGTALTTAMTAGVKAAGFAAADEASAQGEAVGDAFVESVEETTDNAENPFASILDNTDITALSNGDLLGNFGAEAGASYTNGIATGTTENAETVKAAGVTVGDKLTEGMTESMNKDTGSITDSIVNMISEAASKVDLSTITDIISGKFTNSLGESLLSQSGVDDETLSGNFIPIIQSLLGGADFSGMGTEMGTIIATSMATSLESDSNKLEVSNSATSLGNEANEGAKKVSTFSSGSYWGEGFNNGMWSWADRVWDTAYKMGQEAVDGIKTGTEEGSPCKTTIRSGKFFAEGLIIGIDMLGAKVQLAGYRMGLRVAEAVDDGIQNGNPNGIVPVLDMSDVSDSIGDFDATYRPVIKPTLDMSGMDPAFMNMQAVVSHKSVGANPVDAATSGTVSPTSFNFTQNNYSPKALSRVAIYRQTKNQFAAVKDMIKK